MNEPLVRTRGGVHAAVRHDSAVGHVTGAARYLDDVPTVPGTLEASLVLSPHAHARICRIDLSRALAAPGVVAAVTAADIPGKNDIAPISSDCRVTSAARCGRPSPIRRLTCAIVPIPRDRQIGNSRNENCNAAPTAEIAAAPR